MTFQFQCPQGHLLESDEAFVGQNCNCPYCGTLLTIPAPPSPASAATTFAKPTESASAVMDSPFAGFHIHAPPTPPTEPQASPPTESREPQLLHIPCPNGHELESPPEMLDQEVLCPHCGIQFCLRASDSIEHQQRRWEEQHRRERQMGQAWLKWAIAVAVLVVLGLLVMIIISAR
jgi:hypothetical protein